MYDHPVTKCSILIGAEDMIEFDWIRQLKDLLTLSDDEIHIHFDNDVNYKIDYQDDDLCFVILQKYIQFFPCCVIFNIIESVEGETIAYNCSNTTKEVMVLPSLQAKDHCMNKMKEYIEFIELTSLYGDKENIYNKFNERIKHEIGDIEDQCGSMGLDLHFKNTKSFENENKIERVYQTTISGKSNLPNTSMNVDISYLEDFFSTLSGIVQCDDDLYLITTGHGMSDECTPKEANHKLIGRIWPSAIATSDAKEFESYGGTLSGGTIESFVSDVAILALTEDKEENFKCPFTDANIIAEYTKIHKINVPILPNLSKLKEKINYSGYMTQGEMEVIGSGLFCQKLNRNWIYERFYVAKHVPKLVELVESIVDNDYSSIGTLPGDSGACVTTKEGAIHSFVIGKTSGADQFRLLSLEGWCYRYQEGCSK